MIVQGGKRRTLIPLNMPDKIKKYLSILMAKRGGGEVRLKGKRLFRSLTDKPTNVC